MTIHPSAIIDSQAHLDSSVTVGPYAVIEGPVVIGADCTIGAHAVLSGNTTLGTGNQIGNFTTLGAPPQDLHYQGEPTELIIGNDNHLREYVSIHRGTVRGNGKTVLGNGNMVMAYSHIAHDCVVGNQVIMANVATLAGHVEIGDHANLGGMVAIHQFCRVGSYAYIGGMSGITLDVPPYVIMEGVRNRMRIAGVNKIGLRRAGIPRNDIKLLDEAFRLLFRSPDLVVKDALAKIQEELAPSCEAVQYMVDFFNTTKRGVVKRTMDT